jgi:glutathione S-transferase
MLTLYYHPISSFSWKALIALYENDTPFEPFVVDQNSYAEFKALWPIAKFPVLRDSDRNELVRESSLVIEYLDTHYRGRTRFVPDDPDAARETRFWDRFFDNYVNIPVGKIVIDRIRPAGKTDPQGAEEARALIRTAYDVLEDHLGAKEFVAGDAFSMAECAAAPALYYAVRNVPLESRYPRIAAYRERLIERPSFARAFEEAQPLFHLYPGD